MHYLVIFFINILQLYDTIYLFLYLTDRLEPVRATVIIGSISLLIALVLLILKIFVMKDKKNILFLAIGSTFVGGNIFVYSVIHFCLKNCNTI